MGTVRRKTTNQNIGPGIANALLVIGLGLFAVWACKSLADEGDRARVRDATEHAAAMASADPSDWVVVYRNGGEVVVRGAFCVAFPVPDNGHGDWGNSRTPILLISCTRDAEQSLAHEQEWLVDEWPIQIYGEALLLPGEAQDETK